MIKNFLLTKIKKNINIFFFRTRFPPEPNGHLHFGHMKSLFINYNLYHNYKNKKFNVRFDNTNPKNEKNYFINNIKQDIIWVTFNKQKNNIYYTSSYFETLYELSKILLCNGNSYVCGKKNIKKTFYVLDKKNLYKTNTIKKNIKLLVFLQICIINTLTIKAKTKENLNNMTLREPILYRNKCKKKYKWIYLPTYDFSHSLSDALEKISYSICTLEFTENKFIYNWFLKKIFFKYKPKQLEVGKLQLSHTIISKREITKLIQKNYIQKWDDLRLLTIKSLKQKLKKNFFYKFLNKTPITKQQTILNIKLLESFIKKKINIYSTKVNLILNPILLVLNNIKSKFLIITHKNEYITKITGYKKINSSIKLLIERKDIICLKYYYRNNNYKNLLELNLIKLIKKTLNKKQLIKLQANKIKKKNIKNKIDIIQWLSATEMDTINIQLFDKLSQKNNFNKKIIYSSKKTIIKKKIELNNNITSSLFLKCNRVGFFYLKKNKKIKKIKRILKLKIN